MKTVHKILAFIAIAIVLAVLLEPTHIARGWLFGESFYRGRPTSYWSQMLTEDSADGAAAMRNLEEGKSESIEVLSDMIRLPQNYPSRARYTAAEILGNIGPDSSSAGDVMLTALDDPDLHVRTVAATALPKIGVPASKAVPALIQNLQRDLGVPPIRALCEYRSQAIGSLDVLIEIVRNRKLDNETRWNAARTIGRIGSEAGAAIPALIECLEDPAWTVREHSAESLGLIGIGSDQVVSALAKGLSDPATRVRRDAIRSLGQIGEPSRAVIPAMLHLLNDPEEIVRVAARDAIRAVAPEQLPAEKSAEPNTKPTQQDKPAGK